MAIISAYPVGTPAAGDYLVGSDITTTGAQLNPTKNFVISDVVATGLGYTAYNALVTQTGVLAPVISDLKNNTGATMTWTRTGVGTYRCTASSNGRELILPRLGLIHIISLVQPQIPN